MSRPCLLDAGMSREVVSSLSDTIREPAGIHEPVIWHQWNYEPSMSRPCPDGGVIV